MLPREKGGVVDSELKVWTRAVLKPSFPHQFLMHRCMEPRILGLQICLSFLFIFPRIPKVILLTHCLIHSDEWLRQPPFTS